jgi:cytochrome bd ubiquinol oxidase subunit II
VSLELLALAVVILGLIAYTVFGGADFGGGVWTALASGPRAHQQQEAIFLAMGPVWETNHIWLILVVVTLFTAFPTAFALLFTVLLVPLVVALVGIVFRGAAFAFRHFGQETETGLPATGLVFSAASLLTPMALGVALGSTAAGGIGSGLEDLRESLWRPYFQPFPLMCGLIGVTVCGFLTACFMTTRTRGVLQEDFRRRGLVSAIALGLVTTAALPVAWQDAPAFWNELVKPDAVAAISSASIMGIATLAVLWRRWYALAPPAAAVTAAMIILGWGLAQYPYFLLPVLTVNEASAPEGVLGIFLISLAVGSLILVPSLWLLYRTFTTSEVGKEGDLRDDLWR